MEKPTMMNDCDGNGKHSGESSKNDVVVINQVGQTYDRQYDG